MERAFDELVAMLDHSPAFEIDSSASPKILATFIDSDGTDCSVEILVREI